jgi:hypothetical protein
MNRSTCLAPRAWSAALLAIAIASLAPAAQASTPSELLQGWSAQGGASPSASRGERFFTERHGRDWSCSTCHGTPPTGTGSHASTSKPIRPLAPAANPERFTDAAKVEKWFRRNCNDVVGRECTSAEKADVLSWLLSIRA